MAATVAPKKKRGRKEFPRIGGLLKGLKIDEKEFEEAKRSLFKRSR